MRIFIFVEFIETFFGKMFDKHTVKILNVMGIFPFQI